MSRYVLRWKKSAQKELRKLPKAAVTKLVALAESLVDDPHSDGCRKLAGTDHSYWVRAGDYRIIYQVHNGQLIIEIVKVGHWKEVYR
ncbi:type II toxin-antitoxin system RelE family toxin [Endozoicomonas euniceicola]|uniref:Type II toxin-antitoxin system RelE/ParE family toxin n=1 Tax=Endozoicomonas euniceicola TaxID=1234143 RepID=A0ABY6H0Y6_9GAMM|nr:type II toxin-antitoxin system RelE/ParE family toxin [Endozoicomonas euniceicola]UYM18726.1 type II toxin-antitoxin system RelE/ParE family toxin [Endozoicomonas euniceicola]